MSKPFTIMDVKFYPKDECAEAKRKLSRITMSVCL